MKRVIVCAVLCAALSASAGFFGQSGYIEADIVTGSQSNDIATALQPDDASGLNVATAVSVTGPQSNMVETALQPSWATTGTVNRAEAAAMLVSQVGNSWLEYGSNGMLYVFQVTNTPVVYISDTNGAGYNGPPIGTTWTNAVYVPVDTWAWDSSGGASLLAGGPSNAVNQSTGFLSYYDASGGLWASSDGIELSAWMSPVPDDAFAVGIFRLSWITNTNVFRVATQSGTVILLSEHDGDPDAHPTLPRSNDVINIVSAAGFKGGTLPEGSNIVLSAGTYTNTITGDLVTIKHYNAGAVDYYGTFAAAGASFYSGLIANTVWGYNGAYRVNAGGDESNWTFPAISSNNEARVFASREYVQDGYSPTSHVHAIAAVTGLQTALDGKVAASSGTLTNATLVGAVTLTNSTTFAAGAYLGGTTNGVFFTNSGTNYWILFR